MKKVRLLLLCALCFGFNVAIAQNNEPLAKTTSSNSENCVLRYFYYPNLQAYYDTKDKIYHLRRNGKWFTAAEIPKGFAGYSIYNNLNVPIDDYDDDNITQFLEVHKKKFPYVSLAKMRTMTAAVR
jgi:hypothetical protein